MKSASSSKKGAWGTRLGFYLAAIGSAFGLGNLWRFPYVVAENGGGAFVLLYVALVFVIGMPFLVGELLLGKTSRKSVIMAMLELRNNKKAELERAQPGGGAKLPWVARSLPWVGFLSAVLCLIVLAYYAVISGWVLHFFMQFLVPFFSSENLAPNQALNVLLDNGWLQVLLTSVHLLLVMVIVAKDVEEGIERWVGYMMPAFVVLLIVLAVKSLSLDTAPEALRFLLYPDFSKLRISSLGQALGHVLFTLSIGFGTMFTFGSYLQEKSYIPIAGFRVATLDSMISLFAGVLIFPLVLASQDPIYGPELLFQTVPVLFGNIEGGHIFGIGFFLCLYLAALGASIGLLETIVSNVIQVTKMKRSKAAILAVLLCFIVALVPALSSSLLASFKMGGRGVLELLDAGLINWLLPIAALVISQVVAYQIDDKLKRNQFIDRLSVSSTKLYSHWMFALKWVAPPIIILALVLQLVGLFR